MAISWSAMEEKGELRGNERKKDDESADIDGGGMRKMEGGTISDLNHQSLVPFSGQLLSKNCQYFQMCDNSLLPRFHHNNGIHASLREKIGITIP